MASNTVKLSPITDGNESDIDDNWVNIIAKSPNQTTSSSKAMESPTTNIADTLNSLKEQVSQMTAALTILKAHTRELETKMYRLESERIKATYSG